MEILYRAGKAGILPALEVLDRTDDMLLRLEISQYLEMWSFNITVPHRQSLESLIVQERLKNVSN